MNCPWEIPDNDYNEDEFKGILEDLPPYDPPGPNPPPRKLSFYLSKWAVINGGQCFK